MTTVYPLQIDTTSTLPSAIDNSTPVEASVVNRLRDAILVIEAELGVKPSGVYGTVRNRLDFLELLIVSGGGFGGGGGGSGIVIAGDIGGVPTHPLVVGLQSRPISPIAPSIGQTIIWNGTAWIPSTNFIATNITTTGVTTTGVLVSGPATTTSITTGLETLTGKFVVNSIGTISTLSDSNQGIIYFDGSHFKVSENGGAYVNMLGTNAGALITTTTSPYAVLASDDVIAITSGGTVTLEASPSSGRTVKIKDSTGIASGSNITISGNGHNIDGASTYIIAINYGEVQLIYTGTQWSIF